MGQQGSWLVGAWFLHFFSSWKSGNTLCGCTMTNGSQHSYLEMTSIFLVFMKLKMPQCMQYGLFICQCYQHHYSQPCPLLLPIENHQVSLILAWAHMQSLALGQEVLSCERIINQMNLTLKTTKGEFHTISEYTALIHSVLSQIFR